MTQYRSQNTKISLTFISRHITSWQCHLQRIALFLSEGEDVWWRESDEGYEFPDGAETAAPATNTQLGEYHFRDTTLKMVQANSKAQWRNNIEDGCIQLPTPYIRFYDCNGEFTRLKYYKGALSQHENPTIDSTVRNESSVTMDTQEEAICTTPMSTYEQDNEQVTLTESALSLDTTTTEDSHGITLQSKLAIAIEKHLPNKKNYLVKWMNYGKGLRHYHKH